MRLAGTQGPRTWSMVRDREGYRTYTIVYRVEGNTTDGPHNALNCPGLPQPGDSWSVDGDSDPDCYCKLDAQVKPVLGDGKPNKFWDITLTFTNKSDDKRDKSNEVDNPLDKPQEISGGFSKYQEEATRDRFGFPIINSAFEQFRGPQVEFDASRDQVKVSQNVPQLELALVEAMKDCLNGFTMWGMPPRTVKLSNFTWKKEFYGKGQHYFQRTFEFEIRSQGFDRDLLDEGTKVLSGKWDKVTGNYVEVNIAGSPPNRNNPAHFIRAKDRQGENCRLILNGRGMPASVITGTQDLLLSIQSGNVNHEVNDLDWWITLGDDPTTTRIFFWKPLVTYQPGNFVQAGDVDGSGRGIYVCVTPFTRGTTFSDSPIGGNPDWLFIDDAADVNSDPLFVSDMANNRGDWTSAATYFLADYVQDNQNFGPGVRHVEKYNEADFVGLLKLPADLEA